MATFNGMAIFGICVNMQAGVINPFRAQVNTFPGLDFGEELRQGADGAYTLVKGKLGGSNGAGLAAAESIFRSFYDGQAYVLVDNVGLTWGNVKLESFVPEGRVDRNYWTGWVYRHYTAKFKHIDY